MKREYILPGAIVLLALGLFANAAALFLARDSAPGLITSAQAASPGGEIPGIFYLGRDTYFITSSSDGNSTYLWYYDFDPQSRDDNRIYPVTSASAPKR